MAKFYICALGCKVNSYEIDAIKSDLLANNHQYVNEKEADVIIVNTCCVTNTAASKSRQKINSIHKNNPNADIIVMAVPAKFIGRVSLELKKYYSNKQGIYLEDLSFDKVIGGDCNETIFSK